MQETIVQIQAELTELAAKVSPNADEAAVLANSEEIAAGLTDILNSVKSMLHKIG